MSGHPLKIRLADETFAQLELVAKTVNSTMNKLVQQAVELYLQQESARLAEQLSPRLDALRKYAASGETARRAAIDEVINAEAEHGDGDPVEGVMVPRASSTKR